MINQTEYRKRYELTVIRDNDYKFAVYTVTAESLKDLETMKYLLRDVLPEDYIVTARVVTEKTQTVEV